ncbi:hypothetical protein M885DRAFT_503785 [Pelagophyceae sp. CCMP2097]|nr:hypothetical protein M885DRAFT_503785 [Pelagophyceae sp. CCMP2097]
MRLAVSALVLAAAGPAQGNALGECTTTLQTPGIRFGKHRDFVAPEGMPEDARWTAALCCINTHAESNPKAAQFRLVNFDGDGYDYDVSTYAEAAQQAYSEICGMSMGSSECLDNADCIDKALRGGADTTASASVTTATTANVSDQHPANVSAHQQAADPAADDPDASTWFQFSNAASAFAASW